MLKQILPLLIAAKVKIGALATLAYFAIGLIAKKAVLASLVAILISGYMHLKSYLQNKGAGGITGYNAGGWNSGASSGWASPVASSGSWQSSSSGWDSGASQGFSGYHG